MAGTTLTGSTSGSYRWRDDPFLGWRLSTYAALFALAALAWWMTASRTRGMDMAMGPGDVAFFMVTWVVMMAAMMFPSVAPMVATYVSVQRGRRARQMPAAVGGSATFVAGYLVAWAVVGLLCYGVLRLADTVAGSSMFWSDNARWVVVAVLVGAAVYELTPAKYACLRRCRTPMSFVVHHWRNGQLGAGRMGATQGLWCVGCCWGLMAALVALGMMNLAWMAVVSLLIAVEKVLPRRGLATTLVVATLVGLAVAVAVAPTTMGLMA